MSEQNEDQILNQEEVNAGEDESVNKPQVVTSIEEIQPLTYELLCGRILNSITRGEFGHNGEEVQAIFAKQFGADFRWENIPSDIGDKRLQKIATDELLKQLQNIQKKGVSMTDTNIDEAMREMFDLVGLKFDLSVMQPSVYKAFFMQRVGKIAALTNTYSVLENSKFMYGLYDNSSVSPEINAYVLKMQNLYRNGAIEKDILAWYYYDVAMVYEKYSLQKNNTQAIYKEHSRSVNYMKKALSKTTKDTSLLLNIRDALSVEHGTQIQDILDACHRVMDNVSDNESLYLVHKLYAETLAGEGKTDGFSEAKTKRDGKITEHYRSALGYSTNVNDKLDILEALAKHQQKIDKDGYVKTGLEIAELLSGRQRIRALKNLERQVSDKELKKVLIKGAINEFVELDEIHHEDKILYNVLDYKLRELSKEEPEVIRKLNKLKKKYGQTPHKEHNTYFSPSSSKGHDLFVNDKDYS